MHKFSINQQRLLLLLAIAGAQIPGLVASTKPGQSVDCDSGWINQTIENARSAISPTNDGGIPEGERNQIAEVYKVPPAQIRLAPRQEAAPVQQSSVPLAVPVPAPIRAYQAAPLPPTTAAATAQKIVAGMTDAELAAEIATAEKRWANGSNVPRNSSGNVGL